MIYCISFENLFLSSLNKIHVENNEFGQIDFIISGREVLDEAAAAVGVGVTTDELDRIVHEASVDRECYPSPLNYYQFPKR